MADGQGNGSGAPVRTLNRDAFYLQQLVEHERPARMVGLFTMRHMKPTEIERLVDVCVRAMREEDAGAALTLSPMGSPSPKELEQQRTWRVTVQDGAKTAPHDCLVQVFDVEDASSPHRALLDHLAGMEEALGEQGRQAAQNSMTYLTVASGKLDHADRVHPYQNLVSLFSSALGAWLVDPAAAIVTQDPAEWADAMEMSLSLEKEMGLLRR